MTRLLTVFLLLLFVKASAQHVVHTEKDYARHPLWIGMMNDTSANFFEVERAFNTYFRHHGMPEGEEAEIGNHHKERARERNRRNKEVMLALQVKRYRLWYEEMLPFVQSDGRIPTPSERIAVWKRQQSR